jgi:hypothetical protein
MDPLEGYINPCKDTTSPLENTNLNKTILIGIPLPYNSEMKKYLQENKEEVKDSIGDYIDKRIDNITAGNIITYTECPENMYPQLENFPPHLDFPSDCFPWGDIQIPDSLIKVKLID